MDKKKVSRIIFIWYCISSLGISVGIYYLSSWLCKTNSIDFQTSQIFSIVPAVMVVPGCLLYYFLGLKSK